ncbi:hypothetical protein EN932_04135 [Mesorhizobium sp. M7A.F.Ca.US.002.01.1.1]|uniref:hypothetical protein n=1 Tax=Mesorhizobium sp. M7A.F.Ca.US.002.01.1.1 TaxID=2496700 RepID=UPI000FD513AE|nr:hypothetical protein [Mesorhizobium sp. M7A.F.Ca.US.002.01.1.1]RVA14632.1 hypothetical protein EN932_04135 [Mesorhizobium sp. M7A.F.Ca.US.002.01.1.1]
MSDRLFLGRPAFDPRPYTRVDPLALAEAGTWHVYREWSQALPTEGRAFAPRLQGFSSRCLVAFTVEPNGKGTQDRDQFVVVDPREVCEVLDFRKVDAEAARRQLVEVGQPRLLAGSDSVVAALAGGLCVLVKMVRHPSSDLWVADTSGLEHLQTYAFDERLFEGDQVEERWVTVPGSTVGTATGAVNWCRDTDFLDAVLKRLRKTSQQGPSAPTRAQIGQIVTQFDRAGLLPNSGSDLEPMRERLKTFAPSVGKSVLALDEIVETLSSLTPIRDRLAAELSERRAELESEIRRELETKLLRELDDRSGERDRLAQEVAALATDVVARRAELDRERVALDEARSTLSRELTQLLGELGELPPDADARITVLGRRLAAKLGEAGAAFEVAAAGGPPWATPHVSGGEIKPWSEFDQILQATALRWGYTVDDVLLADVAVRGGRLVVLPDRSAAAFVACYADLVAGGGYGRHVLDPSVISLDDLWHYPGSARHSCFSKTWAAARLDPARFHVVLLDGLHRTPAALWMPGLLEVMQDPRRPRNLLIFASLGTPSVDPDRDWRGALPEVVALCPLAADGASPRLLSRAVGATQPPTRLDALRAPEPTAAEVMDFFTAAESEASASVLEVACQVHRAAWVLGAERAASLAGAVAGLENEASAGLSAGSSWLRERLGNKA